MIAQLGINWQEVKEIGVLGFCVVSVIYGSMKIAQRWTDAKIEWERARTEADKERAARDAARDAAHIGLQRESAERYERMHNGTLTAMNEVARVNEKMSESLDNLTAVTQENSRALQHIEAQILKPTPAKRAPKRS